MDEPEIKNELERVSRRALGENKLTEGERDVLSEYTEYGYGDINRFLRGGSKATADASAYVVAQESLLKRQAEVLDRAIAKSALPEDMILHRKFGADTATRLASLPEGAMFTDKAFLSVAADPRGIKEGYNAGAIEIRAPKGTKALVTNGMSASPQRVRDHPSARQQAQGCARRQRGQGHDLGDHVMGGKFVWDDDDIIVLDHGVEKEFDPNQPRDDHGKWTETGAGEGADGAGSEGSGRARSGGARSPDEASRRAAQAAAGRPQLDGLPVKPLKVGENWYTPGPLATAHDTADAYMRKSGLSYAPPTQYIKVDPERAAKIADEYDKMKHDPTDPKVVAAYDALAKETIAQWKAMEKTGLNVDFIKPGQDDPYAASPRMAAMDVIDNNHLWVFPTDLGYGSGDPIEAAAQVENNPLLAPTDIEIDGHKLVVNDVFRIVHDYFGHFKNGVGFRADGEDNAFRAHAAMFSEAARGALASETRGQNSWLNYGPHGEKNRTAKSADTIYAPQKIGLMPDWTWRDAEKKKSIETEYLWARVREEALARLSTTQRFAIERAKALSALARLRAWDEGEHPRGESGPGTNAGSFTSGGDGGGESESAKGKEDKKPKSVKDFTDDKVNLAVSNPEKFIERWNERVGEDPGEFKDKFMGGLNGTMSIASHSGDQMEIKGTLKSPEGRTLGTFTRVIDLNANKASSSYFALNGSETGQGIGKKMLAGNVEVYQNLGLSKVEVYANIDKGGYAWAKYGYVPSSGDWSDLGLKLERKIERMTDRTSAASGSDDDEEEQEEFFEPTSWDEMTERQQEAATEAFYRDTREEFIESEIQNWRDSGQALDDAKSQVADESFHDRDWLVDALDALNEWNEDNGNPSLPFNTMRINEAISLSYQSGYDGRGDLTVEFNDEKLRDPVGYDPTQQTLPGIEPLKPHEFLTEDMRDEIIKKVTTAFETKTESIADDMEPPSYIAEGIEEESGELLGGRRRAREIRVGRTQSRRHHQARQQRQHPARHHQRDSGGRSDRTA